MEKFGLLTKAIVSAVVWTATATVAAAQTLHSFDFTDGASPYASLIQAADGNLYGTTSGGGAYGRGTVFKITAGGTVTTLYSFCAQTGCRDGSYPKASLIQATDGNFYGTTTEGGSSNACCGTVFRITPAGAFTTLHSFDNNDDGNYPTAELMQAIDGNLYGTTESGSAAGAGTVFQITPGGTLTTLHVFCSQYCTDGGYPKGGLIQASDGNFYGTTSWGGTYGRGTVFKITPAGALTTLHSFDGTDGAYPYSSLIQAADGNFYGTTSAGGNSNIANSYGTIFKITPAGILTTLYRFCTETDCPDGAYPHAGLIQASDGNFYGTSSGLYGQGTVFEITPGGTLVTLHSFRFGYYVGPDVRLVQATDGKFYGTTIQGGSSKSCTYGCGTVFRLGFVPRARLSPPWLSFGNQALDETSAAMTVSLSNTGNALLNIRSVAIDGSSFAISANTCGGPTLGIGESCAVSVTFTPMVLGKLTGRLTFTDNVSNSPQTVALRGTGIASANTETTLTSSLNPSIYGQKLIFTAVVTTVGSVPPSGTVAFTWTDGSRVFSIGTATLDSSGVATLTMPNLNAGPYALTATYKGDVNNLGSSSAVLNQTVLQTTSSASITSSPNPSVQGQAVTFTAKISSPTVMPTGPVTFAAGTTVLGTAQLTGGKATFTTTSLPAGSTVIKVTYNSSSNVKGSSASVTQLVQP